MLVALLFLSVLMHEFGHCFAARFMDGEADEILMWPLGGLAFVRSLPNTPLAHFVVAVGGPLVNVVLCASTGVVLYFVFEHLPPLNPFWDWCRHYKSTSIGVVPWTWHTLPDPVPEEMLEKNLHVILLLRLFWVNWILLLFNTILIGFPFDGGRMLQAALWPRLGYYQATKLAIYSGFFFMVLIDRKSVV